jgi:hypothetical protein
MTSDTVIVTVKHCGITAALVVHHVTGTRAPSARNGKSKAARANNFLIVSL